MTDISPSMTTISPPMMSGAIRLDDQHYIVYAYYEDAIAGINEYHMKPDGTWCCGWVPFRGSPWSKLFEDRPDWQCWDVVEADPLTLTPSIKCRSCGSHGHITAGKWVPA